MALSPEQLQRNLVSAENLARQRAGLPASSMLPDSSFTYEQRVAFNKEMAKIVAQYPDRFNDKLAKTAALVTATQYQPLQSSTLADAVNVFSSELANQAAGLNDALNPLSAANRAGTATTIKWTLVGVGLIAAAAYFLPAGVARARARSAKLARA